CYLRSFISSSPFCCCVPRDLHSFPTRRSSDLGDGCGERPLEGVGDALGVRGQAVRAGLEQAELALREQVAGEVAVLVGVRGAGRSEEHTSELQSRENLVCRLLLEKKKKKKNRT